MRAIVVPRTTRQGCSRPNSAKRACRGAEEERRNGLFSRAEFRFSTRPPFSEFSRRLRPNRAHQQTPPVELCFLGGITYLKETSTDNRQKNAWIRLSSAWASDPQLGLVARCGARAQIHFRGLCHWAGELTAARQAAEPPSRRAAECTSARKPSPPRPHRPQGQFKTHPAKWHVHTPPCSAFRLHSPPTHDAHAWPFVVARATQFRGRKRSRLTGIG